MPSIRHHRDKSPRASAKAGLSPGTLVFIGEQAMHKARIELIEYDERRIDEILEPTPDRCGESAKAPCVSWINVNGIHDVELIESLGKHLEIHPLTREDIVNTTHRPKTEEFPGYFYIVLKMVSHDPATHQTGFEHVSLILGENFVVSFQEKEGDVFDTVRDRLKSAKGRIRGMKADYLAYALMDAVVDNYFIEVERIGDRVEALDDQILADPNPSTLREMHRLKRDILRLRKAVWPLREEIGALNKSESGLIRPGTRMFLRDIYDHTIHIIDMVETFREILASLHDSYLSGISNRMNEIMKVLTMIATIFIPLTFIAGVYGMNFEYMPELGWPSGYFLVLGIMLAICAGMIGFFLKKKWL